MVTDALLLTVSTDRSMPWQESEIHPDVLTCADQAQVFATLGQYACSTSYDEATCIISTQSAYRSLQVT